MGNDKGFALLAVTVVLAVLALILGAVMLSARDFAHDSGADLQSVRIDAGLEAGVVTAARELSGPMGASLHYLRTPQTLLIGDLSVTVSARPETSKIDLNGADVALLAGLLRASGVGQQRAAKLADEIADWRDADSNARPLGAETADYLAAGRREGPPNAPLETETELSELLDGDVDLARCLRPDVTVFTHQSSVDLSQASDRIRRGAAIAEGRSLSSAAAGRLDAAFFEPPATIYEVTVEARERVTGAIRTRQVVMRITGSASRPYWILADTSPMPDAKAAARACARFAARD